jgi:hypothetical protein
MGEINLIQEQKMMTKAVQRILISLALLCATTSQAATPEAADSGYYTTQDKEYYLTANEIYFIRPGLELEVTDVTIPADNQPEVTFVITDPGGLPLDRNGVYTPGPVSTAFMLAYIPEPRAAYISYTTRVQTSPITNESATQAYFDSGGTYTDLGDGKYMYKFNTALPVGYDMDATHTMGMYARRDLREFELDRYVQNALEHFVPSGMSAPVPRDIVTTDTCNRCHDPLAFHGGSRLEVGLCVLCHNATQDIDPDTGNSFAMPLMTHKIHYGAELTEDYTIIGHRQGVHNYNEIEVPFSVNDCEVCHTGGTPTADFPLVANPAMVPICDASGVGTTTLDWSDTGGPVEVRVDAPDGPLLSATGGAGTVETGKWVDNDTVFYLVDATTGNTLQTLPVSTTVLGCVDPPPATFRGTPGAQHTHWLVNQSREVCGSCHDYVNFDTGAGHSPWNFPVTNDDVCVFCHLPTKINEFDLSVPGAHQELYKSGQFPGVLVKFIGVTNTGPGEKPTVTFSLLSKTARLNPANLDRLRFTITGPNEDFSFYAQETVGSAAVAAGDNWKYTFSTPLPADAKGSYTISVEGRSKAVDIVMGDETEGEREYMENPMMAFAVTDATAMERRVVVEDSKCESCHVNISFHGGNRKSVQYCNTCHRPEFIAVLEPQESVHQKWMIHKIHRGAELENGYVVIRSRGTFDFSDKVYVGDLRNCNACHVNNSQQIPLPEGLLATITPQAWWTPMEPISAACLSCHDGDAAAAHAYSNTVFFGEACAACHGEGMSYSVDKVHAR